MIGTAQGVMPLVIDLSPPVDDRGLGQQAIDALTKARASRSAANAARESMANIPLEKRVGRELRQ